MNPQVISQTIERRQNILLSHLSLSKEKAVVSVSFCLNNSDSSTNNTPQSTVITELHPHCAIVTIKLIKRKDFPVVAKACKGINDIVSQLNHQQDLGSKSSPSNQLPACMAGIGFNTEVWTNWVQESHQTQPEGIGPYKRRNGKFGDLPVTDDEILLHVKAATQSLCYEIVSQFVKSLPLDLILTVDDKYGFQYQDGRDLSGFLDGTVNTVGEKRRQLAALNHKGGSFMVHQRFEHDLEKFEGFSLQEQEDIFGRRKSYSKEQDEKTEMKITAHVRRMRDERFLTIPIVRQSMPYGTVG